MKYIKTFEGTMCNNTDTEYQFKFGFGDHVRVNWDQGKQIFYITAIKYNFQEKPINSYYLNYNGKNFGWIKEEDLKLVPEYELDAIKYNL